MKLPFELYQSHKVKTKSSWKKAGLICSEEEFEALYPEYIYATNCDLCGIPYKNTRDRQMEHEHLEGKYGAFRNFVCRSCNQLKKDVKMKSNNTSGYCGIYKQIDKRYKQGFRWRFSVMINGKLTRIKSSVYKDKLIEFADKWKKDNNYHT